MSLLTVGVFGISRKKQEKRLPIHPGHLSGLDSAIRNSLIFEEGYGLSFGVSDAELRLNSGGVMSKEALFKNCDIALIAKPVLADFKDMEEGTIHWGWPHCVQQRDIAQTAIDNKLTLIAWEEMHQWSNDGEWQNHTFQKNNEIAGYAAVHHAMGLRGIDGNYGPNMKAVVISYGSVSRGAIRALQSRGVEDIMVFTAKEFVFGAPKIDGISYSHFLENDAGDLVYLNQQNEYAPLYTYMPDADIIVNGILQDTDHPLMFIPEDKNENLKPGALIVDVSCDEGMAFSFAKPTTFDAPIFKVGNVFYYAVDHTPSFLWNAATWEISTSLLPHLHTIMCGPDEWLKSETIKRAIEIKDGIIQNPKILSFQNREETYPHLEKIDIAENT